jgi:hypothetical protein
MQSANEIYTFNEFFFRLKDAFSFSRAHRVVKYKFEFAKCVRKAKTRQRKRRKWKNPPQTADNSLL